MAINFYFFNQLRLHLFEDLKTLQCHEGELLIKEKNNEDADFDNTEWLISVVKAWI